MRWICGGRASGFRYCRPSRIDSSRLSSAWFHRRNVCLCFLAGRQVPWSSLLVHAHGRYRSSAPPRQHRRPACPWSGPTRQPAAGERSDSKWCGDHGFPADRASTWALDPKDKVRDAPVVNTGNATRLVRKEQPDGSPFGLREFIPHDSRLLFGRLNHVQTDAFNRQNRTSGISEITP